MFKTKNDEYRVPRREKLFRLMTVLALLIALAVLLREIGEIPETAGTAAETPENRFCNNGDSMRAAMAAGGKIYIDCGGVLNIEKTFVITTDTHIVGSGEYSLALSGTHELKTLFVVENGARLMLESLRIIDSTDIAIHVKPGGRLILSNCLFSGHLGRRGMAAAVWNQGGTVYMSACTFTENTPPLGAVFLNSRNGYVDMGGSTFRLNSVDASYASNNAVIQNYGTMRIERSIFDSNKAAIASWRGEITITDTLIKNHSGYYGGVEYRGMALHNETGSVMSVENSQIIDNLVYYGAAVVNRGELTLTNILFARNGETDCLNFSKVTPDSDVSCKNYGG